MALRTRKPDDPRHLNVDFDSEEDVLYVSMGQPVASHTDEAANGVLFRWENAGNSPPSGVTALDFRRNWRGRRRSYFYSLVAEHLGVPVGIVERAIREQAGGATDEDLGEFEEVWQRLQAQLISGQMIRAWSAASEYRLDATYQVQAVNPSSITVFGGKMTMPATIPKSEFRKVWDIWRAYCAGTYRREHLRDITRFSTYIVSILKWIESDPSDSK